MIRERTGQRGEKLDDVRHLRLRELTAQLDTRHHPYGLGQCGYGAVVEVRRRPGDVSECRNLEDVEVGRVVCDVETALVDRVAPRGVPVRLGDSELLVHRP